ncbi:unnamed protein product [Mucor fragilis]
MSSTQEEPERKKLSTCLIAPSVFQFRDSTFEYAVYQPSSRFKRDFESIFPSLNVKQRKELLVVPVIQQCEYDMVGLTTQVNQERDVKLELFVAWGKAVVDRIKSIGMWADIMDPASGFPVSRPCTSSMISFALIHHPFPDLFRGWTKPVPRCARHPDAFQQVLCAKHWLLPYSVPSSMAEPHLPVHSIYHCACRHLAKSHLGGGAG